MKYNLFFLAALLMGQVHAATSQDYPASCQPIAVQKETVLLTTKKPILVMIHNLSQSDMWITHPVSEPSANSGWSSHLQAGHWSALALDKESFELSCIESKPGHEQQVPCNGVISICELATTKIPAKANGTYWAAENMPLRELSEHLGNRGFKLPKVAE